MPAGQAGRLGGILNLHLGGGRRLEGEFRPWGQRSLVVADFHFNYIFQRRTVVDRENRTIEGVAALFELAGGGVNGERIWREFDFVYLCRVKRGAAGAHLPVTIAEFHGNSFKFVVFWAIL
ncbi:MAG TPA: hypothetical protein DEH22_18175 [Chloroflexi bacterium]|nr:hypothetical protein [Chloroflexota bacterium]